MSSTITISQLGRCTLNRAATEQLCREAKVVESILLLWDKETYKVAIKPITKKDNRSFNVRYTKRDKAITGAAFSGVMFLRHIQYDFSETKTYPIRWNADESIFEVDLPKERFHAGVRSPIVIEGTKKQEKHEEQAMTNGKETRTKRKPGRPAGSHRDNSNKAKLFGFYLRRLRVGTFHLTQQQMGELMKVDGGAVPSKIVIARWESGKHYPQRRYIDKFEQVKQMSREEVIKKLAK